MWKGNTHSHSETTSPPEVLMYNQCRESYELQRLFRNIITESMTVVLLVLFAPFSALAHNKTVVIPMAGDDVEFVSPVIVQASEFRSNELNPDTLRFSAFGGYFQGTGASVNDGCLVAPVYLPNGVTLTKMESTVYDNTSAYDNDVRLYRATDVQLGGELIGSTTTADSPGFNPDPSMIRVVESPIAGSAGSIVVDTTSDSFFLETCLNDSNIRLYRVKIFFTSP
jgi:hypothetical protein